VSAGGKPLPQRLIYAARHGFKPAALTLGARNSE
jgi:hypothetical protein